MSLARSVLNPHHSPKIIFNGGRSFSSRPPSGTFHRVRNLKLKDERRPDVLLDQTGCLFEDPRKTFASPLGSRSGHLFIHYFIPSFRAVDRSCPGVWMRNAVNVYYISAGVTPFSFLPRSKARICPARP